MNFLKKIFGAGQSTNQEVVEDIWVWFSRHAAEFFRVVDKHDDVDGSFLQKIMPKLQQINEQFYCLTGMCDERTAELVITAEGDVKSFVFVEDLVARAPSIAGWKFTALKPAMDIRNFGIEMNGLKFNSKNIHFCYVENPDRPDDVEITLICDDYAEEEHKTITTGCLLFLENGLGELKKATLIDEVHVAGACPEGSEAIPIAKLEDFLAWREKELVEKYEGTRHDTKDDEYAVLQAEDEDGLPSVAVVNKDLLEWDAPASHPWMMVIQMEFDGSRTNGMPDEETNALLNLFEDSLVLRLPDEEGYLNVGRKTYDGKRTVYFACKEFRRSSRVASAVIREYQHQLDAAYDIYKDKYWISLDHFRVS